MDKRIYIVKEDGTKLEGEVLFTFEANGDNFVLYELEEKAFAAKLDVGGNLSQIEEDEWKLVEKVYKQYLEDQEEEDNNEDK